MPAAFWMAGFSFMAFAVGYVAMAQRVTTAGDFSYYTTYGFGRVIGLGTAIGIVSAYLLFGVGVNRVTSVLRQHGLQNLFGFSMDWRIYAAIFILLLLLITYFHVEMVRRILGIALLGELVILFIFSFSVLGHGGGPDGILWSALNLAGLFSGGVGVTGAAKVFGASGGRRRLLRGLLVVGRISRWPPNYAEETRNPKKTTKYALFGSVIGLTIVFTFWSRMLPNPRMEARRTSGRGRSRSSTGSMRARRQASACQRATMRACSTRSRRSSSAPGSRISSRFKSPNWLFASPPAFWNTSNRYLFDGL